MIKTDGGHSVLLDDTPGLGGITLETAAGHKIALTAHGIEITTVRGATIKLRAQGVGQQRGAGRDLMPGYLLHVGATVICSHGGQAQPTVPNPRVMVSGQPTVTMGAPYVVAGCALTGTPNPPCVTANWLVGATRLLSQGQPLLLQDSQSITVAPATPLQVLVTQLRVQGQ